MRRISCAREYERISYGWPEKMIIFGPVASRVEPESSMGKIALMQETTTSTLARRDWLKATSFGAAAAMFGAVPAIANTASPRKRVKGVVFLVSDGMSPGVFTLAEAFSQKMRGTGTVWWKLWSESNATRGLMDTASADSLVTDSAAAASAWGGGKRVNNGAINIDPDGNRIEPISEALKAAGAKLGLVTTTRMTHATPAGFASAVANRGMEEEIAGQYLDQADVLLGGGAKFFDPALFGKFEKAGYALVRDRAALLDSREAKILGIFGEDHLPYSVDHIHDSRLKAKVPTLAEMTSAALDRFLTGDAPFLLMVEGGRVDHAAHLNCIAGVLHDQLAFDDAVGTTLAKTMGREDILVVVTSDHGNSNPGLNGIGRNYELSNDHFAHASKLKISHDRFQQIWRSKKDATTADLKSFVEEHLHFTATDAELDAIHESMRSWKADDWNHQHRNWEGLLGQVVGNHTGIGWTGVSHTSDPTLVSAVGPEAERFGGLVVNTDVNRHLKELLLG